MRPHLCHIFPAFSAGGPEVRTCLLINASAGEFRHTVVSLSGELDGRERVRPGHEVDFVAAPRAARRIAHPFVLARCLKALRPDLVLTYGWGGTDGVLAARLSGMRRVIHAEDGFLPDEAHRQKLPRLLARRLVLRAPACVVCPSKALVGIARRLWFLPARKVRYLPNGVDERRFAPPARQVAEEARRRLGCAEGEVVIGTVGHLRAEKNQARLIRAFAVVAARRPVKLLIGGGGPLKEQLTALSLELGVRDRVIFSGLMTDPVPCYHAMDVFALSSDTEQMPLALLEAMSVGLPLVSTDVGDVRTMVSAPNRRCVVPAADEQAYAQALDRLAADGAERSFLGRSNREKCQREYGITVMVEAYCRLYREVLKSERG
jgi:glycosyltransferase involved in cell wall biosynthesis